MKSNESINSTDNPALEALLCQLFETELGGVQIYRNALRSVQSAGLEEEWEKYLGETQHHVEVAQALVVKAGLDPDADVQSRLSVRFMSESLVGAMNMARERGTPKEKEMV